MAMCLASPKDNLVGGRNDNEQNDNKQGSIQQDDN
jgi:hypothetical protein